MSEVLRTFTRPGAGRRRRSGTVIRNVFLGVFALLFCWTAWVTRDSQDLFRLVPARQDYRIYLSDFLGKRGQIAESQVWGLAPEGSWVGQAQQQLSSNFGMPEWVLNNLMSGVCLISGDDLQTFSDLLLTTRMTRVGCLIEKIHGFVPGIEEDHAGGLELRFVRDTNMYYAVRGRVLLASLSRDALIRALTLSPDQAVAEDALEKQLASLGEEDLFGHVQLAPEDPMGDVFEEVWVALRMGPAQAQLSCRGQLRPEWRSRSDELLRGVTPQTLRPAPEGLLTITANLGMPLPKLYAGLNELWPEPWGLHQQLFGWLNTREGGGAAAATMLNALLSETGPAWALSWHGIDTLAMVPMPEIVGVLEADPGRMQALFTSWPQPPAEVAVWESVARYDDARQVVYLPLPGGPALEPTAAIQGNGLLISSSRKAAAEMLSKPVPAGVLQRKGNVYVELSPQPAVQALLDAGLEFARFGALRGYTEASFREAGAQWLATAERIKKVSAFALHEEGMLELDFSVEMQDAGTPAPLAAAAK